VAIPYPSKQRKLSAGRWSIWDGDFATGGASISHFIHARKLAVDKQHFVTPRQGASFGQQGFTPTATLIASQIDRRKPFWPHQSTTGAESSSHLVFFLHLTENSDSETDEISLLSAQSAHLSAARVCHSAGL